MATYKTFTNDDGVEVDIRSDIPETLARLTALEGVTGKTILGAIIMFSGSFDENGYPYPTGTTVSDKSWHICDGTHGTPDLVGRFIKGCAASDIGSTSESSMSGTGTISGTTSSDASGGTIADSSTGGSIGGSSLSVEQLASHRHYMYTYASEWRGESGGSGGSDSKVYTDYTGSGYSHTHSFTGSSHSHTISGTEHSHTVSGTLTISSGTCEPSSYALAYIMKIA